MKKYLLPLILLFSCSKTPTIALRDECRQEIYNRGAPDQAFIDHLIQWAKASPDSYFTTNPYTDVYSLIKPVLAPDGWRDLTHRRAAGIEALIVLGAYESSFSWTEGRDWSNTTSGTACTEEAGMWQTSGNTLHGDLFKGMGLLDLFNKECSNYLPKGTGANECRRFIRCSKDPTEHNFATSYTWLVIRKTLKHHGPLLRASDVKGHLRPKCEKQIEDKLSNRPSSGQASGESAYAGI